MSSNKIQSAKVTMIVYEL